MTNLKIGMKQKKSLNQKKHGEVDLQKIITFQSKIVMRNGKMSKMPREKLKDVPRKVRNLFLNLIYFHIIVCKNIYKTKIQ